MKSTVPNRSRRVTMATLLDDSNLPDLFYPKFSEAIIPIIFKQNKEKLFWLMKKAEDTLNPEDYSFEITNAHTALKMCGELELALWFACLKTDQYEYWKRCLDSYH